MFNIFFLIKNKNMNSKEHDAQNAAQKKQKIRERYKGIDSDELEVIQAIPKDDFYDEKVKKRVAVYARVSTDDPRQTSSYELQKNHYTDMVNHREDWELYKIYADEGISGTSLQHRDAFVEMIKDCNDHKIDLIVTKSVSRFARNVLDCIGYVRKLKSLNPPIGVFFETENIYTLNPNSEMSLSFIATLAQEESHNKSEIMNSSIEMRFKRGIFLTPVLLGYDQDENGNLIINEKEAAVVRLIFFLYLYGYSIQEIAGLLSKLGCVTKRGNKNWSVTSIQEILQNERHCGDVVARKTWTPSYLDHKSKKNKQDRNQYIKRNHHESIVSRDDFIAVQHMLAKGRSGKHQYLPYLHVISKGVFKGFVIINTKWGNFTSEDYLTASDIAVNSALTKTKKRYSAKDGDFDLRGFEVARVQFISTSDKSTLTINESYMTFNNVAINKLKDAMMIELLIHPKAKMLVVRPCKKEDKYSVHWRKVKNDAIVSSPIKLSSFLPVLYELMKWKKGWKYRCVGSIKECDGVNVLIFNLSEAWALVAQPNVPRNDSAEKPNQKRRKKMLRAYPEEWSATFGENVYSRLASKEAQILNADSKQKESKESYCKEKLNVTPDHEVKEEIDNLIDSIQKAKEDESQDNVTG